MVSMIYLERFSYFDPVLYLRYGNSYYDIKNWEDIYCLYELLGLSMKHAILNLRSKNLLLCYVSRDIISGNVDCDNFNKFIGDLNRISLKIFGCDFKTLIGVFLDIDIRKMLDGLVHL
jgi:hypothetical protein